MTDTIPTDHLNLAHLGIDHMIERVREEGFEATADNVWKSVMTSVDKLPDDQAKQSLALLLTVALQRLAQK